MYKNILLSNFNIDVDHEDYRKLLLTNLAFLFALSVYIVFAFVNYFIRENIVAGVLESFFIVPTLYGFFKLRKDHDLEKATAFVCYLLFVTILSVLFIFEFQECVGAWALLFPFVAMSLRGAKKGLYLVLVFDLLAYANGFYFWYIDKIPLMDMLRFVNVSVFITILVYLYEKAVSNAYEKQKILQNSLKESLHKTQTLAITDALTGLYNKRHFDTVFSTEFNRAKRENRPFHFAIVDIDNFKPFNDLYGHEPGDAALRKVGCILQDQTKRSGDYAFRVGGEEFALILQSCSSGNFEDYLNELRETIEAKNIKHDKNKPYGVLTVSIGAVSLVNYDNMTTINIYITADQNLYFVKKNGRNAVKHSLL